MDRATIKRVATGAAFAAALLWLWSSPGLEPPTPVAPAATVGLEPTDTDVVGPRLALFDATDPSARSAPPVAPVQVAGMNGPFEVAAGEVLFAVSPGAEEQVVADLEAAGAHWVARGATNRWRAAFAAQAPVPELLARVAALDGVGSVTPNAVTRAASCGAGDLEVMMWERGAVSAPTACADDSSLAPVVIAILDTGVAYEDHSDTSGSYVAASELSGVPVVHPWDFVNGDAHANDDHQHGTHIASLIAARDRLQGHAPNPVLMPIKVLDDQMVGTEWTLIEGIAWAADHGAQVINLSLSYSPGYLPSPALLQAISIAEDAGVVVVAAVGNDDADTVSYPAALPGVVAVTAAAPADASYSARETVQATSVAAYGNDGWATDVVAPGGDVSRTVDLDGTELPAGMLGQTIHPDDPTEVGYWLMAGTSQATAIASSQASWLLGVGAAPQEVRDLLVIRGVALQGQGAPSTEAGRGMVDGNSLTQGDLDTTGLPQLFVNSVLGIEAHGDGYRAVTWVEVIDDDGEPVEHTLVRATVRGSVSQSLTGTTALDGRVRLTSEVVTADADDPLLFLFTVDAVQVSASEGWGSGSGFADRFPAVPGRFVRLSEGSAATMEAAGNEDPDAALLMRVDSSDPDVCDLFDCDDLVDSYQMQTLGGGFSSSTVHVSFNWPYLSALGGAGFSSSTIPLAFSRSYWFPWGSSDEGELEAVDLGGTGFSSSTVHVMAWNPSLFGTGFSSSTIPVLSYSPFTWGSGFSSSTIPLVSVSSALSLWGSGFSSSTIPVAMWSPYSLTTRGSGFSSSTIPVASYSLRSWNLWGSGFSSSTIPLMSSYRLRAMNMSAAPTVQAAGVGVVETDL